MAEEIPWEGKVLEAAWKFGAECKELHAKNPYKEEVALDRLIMTLMAELWDRNFSQSEIRSAFEGAVAEMPRYAAGLERRSDGPY